MVNRRVAVSRFERLTEAINQPQPDAQPNRDPAQAAVADPYGLTHRRVRVTVNLDVLDRLLRARRIGPGEHAAGRTYERLLEIALGAGALDRGGASGTYADDIAVKGIERARVITAELRLVRRIIGDREEALLRRALVELDPNTGASWTIAGLAAAGGNPTRRQAEVISKRLARALELLASHWRRVRLD